MTIPASDCATHNGPTVGNNPTQEAVKWLRSMAAIGNALPLGSGPRKHADRLARWAEAIEAQTTTLRTARALIASLHANDFNCYTIAGIADTMDDAERAAIAEYDAVLAQIDEVLK